MMDIHSPESIFITADPCVHYNALEIVKCISDPDMDSFINIVADDNKLYNYMMCRNERDVFKWLAKEPKTIDSNMYRNALGMTDIHLTKFFINLVSVYGRTKSSYRQIVISTDIYAPNFKKLKNAVYEIAAKPETIIFVDDSEETILEYITKEDINVLVTDRTDLIKKNIDVVVDKMVLVPETGYTMTLIEAMGTKMLVTKDYLEATNIKTISTFKPGE